MTKIFLSLLLSLSFIVLPSISKAEETAAKAAQEFLQKTAIESIVKEYLMNNGGVILEAVEKHQREKDQAEQQAAQEAIKSETSFLYDNADSPSIGPSDASVTIVEFFDYNCGFCKRALSDITELLSEDTDLRVVFKEVPILNPSSREVAKWSLASHRQGTEKYMAYHTALMEHKGQYDEASLTRLAEQAGLDVEKVKADKADPIIDGILSKNLDYMNKFGIRGTPSFIIGGEIARGYVGKDRLKEIIKMTRGPKEQ